MRTEQHNLAVAPLQIGGSAAPWLAQLAPDVHADEPVLIVGAGPIGMTAALSLAAFGIRSILLDDDDKLSDGSRDRDPPQRAGGL